MQFPITPPNEIPIIVADWEKGEWNTIEFNLSGDIIQRTVSSRESLLNGDLWGGSRVLLIVESAHLSPRSNPPQNKSQLFSRGELLELAASLEQTESRLVAFPQSLTKQARAFSGIPDSMKDECDPWAILVFYLFFCSEFNQVRPVSFRNWSPISNREIELRLLANSVREDMTFRLNFFRSIRFNEASPADYDTSTFPNDEVSMALDIARRIMEQGLLSEEAIEYFYLQGDDPPDHLYGTSNAIRIMSLYVCVFDENGRIRTHRTMIDSIPEVKINRYELYEGESFSLIPSEQPIGLRFIWNRLLKMHPYRGRATGAGQMTARSNIMYRGLPSYDNERFTEQHALLKQCATCGAEPGNRCATGKGVPTATHAPRKAISWNEPNELWVERRQWRQEWRRIQKEMLRAMILIGTNDLQQDV